MTVTHGLLLGQVIDLWIWLFVLIKTTQSPFPPRFVFMRHGLLIRFHPVCVVSFQCLKFLKSSVSFLPGAYVSVGMESRLIWEPGTLGSPSSSGGSLHWRCDRGLLRRRLHFIFGLAEGGASRMFPSVSEWDPLCYWEQLSSYISPTLLGTAAM